MRSIHVVDANVILRYLLGDHPEYLEKASAFMAQLKVGEVHAYIPVSLSIILRQIRHDWGYVLWFDRRSHHFYHLIYALLPPLLVQKNRIHPNVIEAVAHNTVGGDKLFSWPILQLEFSFISHGARDKQKID